MDRRFRGVPGGGWVVMGLLLMGLSEMAAIGAPKETSVPPSAFRRYFWGARQAYEDRDFTKASSLFQTYQKLGAPSDRLLKMAGCDPAWEVSVFRTALTEAKACLSQRAKSLFWTDSQEAQFVILTALRAGDTAALTPYVDCAPTDLVMQSTTCGVRHYPKLAELDRLAAVLQKTPDLLKQSTWREFPIPSGDLQNIRWELFTDSKEWQPCGMTGAPIISLRQDPSGEIRIAGFAASCLKTQSQQTTD